MDRILIVEPDGEESAARERYLAGLNQFQVHVARSGAEAAGLLPHSAVNLVVTRMKLPDMDGLDLLAHVSRRPAAVACILLHPAGEGGGGCGEMLQWLPQEIGQHALAAAIFEGLGRVEEGTALGGWPLALLAKLAARLRKTARLEVQSPAGEKGLLYFRDGLLLDAACGALHGEGALERLAGWAEVRLQLAPLPGHRGQRRIDPAVMRRIGLEGPPPEVLPPAPCAEQAPALRERADAAAAPAADGDHRVPALLKGLARELRSVKGWSAVAVMAPGGRLLAVETAESSASCLQSMGQALSSISRRADQVADHCLQHASQGLTMQTERHAVMLRPFRDGPRATLQLVGLLTLPGNLYFMQMQIDRAAARFASRLSAAEGRG